MMTPKGWLIEPHDRWLLLFHKDPMSLKRLPQIFIDKWEVSTIRTPLTFINRRKVDLEPAIETWNELTSNGWEKIELELKKSA